MGEYIVKLIPNFNLTILQGWLGGHVKLSCCQGRVSFFHPQILADLCPRFLIGQLGVKAFTSIIILIKVTTINVKEVLALLVSWVQLA